VVLLVIALVDSNVTDQPEGSRWQQSSRSVKVAESVQLTDRAESVQLTDREAGELSRSSLGPSKNVSFRGRSGLPYLRIQVCNVSASLSLPKLRCKLVDQMCLEINFVQTKLCLFRVRIERCETQRTPSYVYCIVTHSLTLSLLLVPRRSAFVRIV
jgi:hypothetical protein